MLTILLVLLGTIPGIAWLVFYLREDIDHPEPKRLIIYAFLAGALITVLVLKLQIIVHSWANLNGFPTYSFASFLLLAGVEELFKFLAVYITVSRRKEFDEPVDAMVYMIVAALGFATVENIGSVFQSNNAFLAGPGPLETTVLRFVGATLLHTLSSGVVGYYWGKALAKHGHYTGLIVKGLLIGTLLHAVFNYLIIKSEPVALPLIFLLFVAMFVLSDFEKLKHPKDT